MAFRSSQSVLGSSLETQTLAKSLQRPSKGQFDHHLHGLLPLDRQVSANSSRAAEVHHFLSATAASTENEDVGPEAARLLQHPDLCLQL
jgi:hypothetical protein